MLAVYFNRNGCSYADVHKSENEVYLSSLQCIVGFSGEDTHAAGNAVFRFGQKMMSLKAE